MTSMEALKYINVDRMRSAVILPICYVTHTGLNYVARHGRSQFLFSQLLLDQSIYVCVSC